MTERWLYAWGLGAVAFGGASLLIPLYAVELGANPFLLGILAASGAFLGAPGALVVGRIADRTGKRRVFVVGVLALVAVTLAAMPLLSSIPLVIALNAVVWFAFAAAGPILTLLVTIGYPESQWQTRIAVLNKYQGWGWAGGLVVGVVWTTAATRFLTTLLAQRAFFGICAAGAGVATVAVARWLPAETETSKRPREQGIVRALARARRTNIRGATFPFAPSRLYWTTRSFDLSKVVDRFTPTLTLYFVAAFLFFAGFSIFFAPLPIFLTGTGSTSGAIFGLYLASSLGSAAFYVGAGELASRYDITLLQTGGLLLRAVTLPAVAVIGAALAATLVGTVLTGATFVVIGVAWAIIAVTATTLVTRLAPAAIRGEVLGVYAALSAVAGGVGSVLGGWLAGRGFTLAFGVAGVLVFGGAVLVLLIRRLARPTQSPTPETT